MAASDREAALLARVAANHLFLGQFEALRAALLSLRRRGGADPDLAAGFLRAVVAAGGRVPGVLWSGSACPSPSHLAWLAALELAALPSTPNPEALRLKAEFLVLLQHVADDPATGDEARGTLSRLLDLGVARLGREVDGGGGEVGVGAEEAAVSQEDLRGLWGVFLDKAELFDALCAGVSRQVALDSGFGTDVLLCLRRSVQLAHLDAVKSLVAAGDLEGATGHLRFLCLDHGVEEDEYKVVLGELVRTGWPKSSNYGLPWFESHDRIFKMFGSSLQSSSPQLVQLIQLILDDIISEEIEDHGVSDANWMPLPFKKFMETLSLERGTDLADKTMLNRAITSCKKDLYHYSRLPGKHVLEVVMETVLSFIKREQLEEAANVISMFPLLQPLVAVLGWDILKGKTALRRKLMLLFWIRKSQALRLQEYPHYRKQTDEVLLCFLAFFHFSSTGMHTKGVKDCDSFYWQTSCEEYLCDLLCFHLDVACFVSSVNSGRPWNLRNSLLFSQQEQDKDVSTEILDPFVENLILERLAVQTPIRVLFDVVPGIRFEDAIELVGMLPLSSTTAIRKRMHDIELMHMRYALQSVALSLGEMEKSAIDGNEHHYQIALSYLREMQNFMEAIKSTPRKIYIVSIVLSLLHMDDSIKLSEAAPSECSVSHECFDSKTESEEKNMVTSFVGLLLDILRHNLVLDVDHLTTMGLSPAGRQALEWRLKHAKHAIEDLDWRLSVLQRLPPLSERQWSWKEALVLLRAAPSKLLNVCMQRANYDIGEEAVQRFSLPAEDKASLELAEWVAGAYRIALVEDAVNRATDSSNTTQELDILSFRAQLGPLTTATSLLSEIFPGSSPKVGPNYWDQIQEVALISVIKRILQRLRDILDQEGQPYLQLVFTEMNASSSIEASRVGQKQRPLGLLHQMIDDAFKGKRQFLNGKLHNVARAIVDEDSDGTYSKEGIKLEKKDILSSEKGVIFGHGLRILKQSSRTEPTTSTVLESNSEHKGSTSRYLGPVSTKPSTYLSNFIIYIATIGDIVDGTDTTHDFNYFSLVYERPKDLLTRLVFERGSTDAAAKVADTMGVDFVHEIISACVPPVFPPRTGQGWACIPLLPTLSNINSESRSQPHDSLSSSHQEPLYPLQLNLVKHLAQLSSVRAVLACVFGSSILSGDSELCSNAKDATQTPETKRSFYEFALEQSERYPTLNRWIQMQCNLHRVSESAVTAETENEVTLHQPKGKFSSKRSREPDSDAESEIEDIVISGKTSSNSLESPKCDEFKLEPTNFVSFDWDNEGPYEKAVERLINEGKLTDALALSDRCLRNGASDKLLQLLIEQREEISLGARQFRAYGSRNFGSDTWQYCLRLRDKKLAAQLALKYLHNWDLDAAANVLTMCICHLPENDPMWSEVLHTKQSLQRYGHIMSADDHYTRWQEVEVDCKDDPEGLALRLAAKGAVPAALEVAESASLSIDLRRELQGRQLVKLLTTDPLNGGGPAAASRFLSTLRDSNDALPVAIGAMKLLPDLRSKQLLVHFFLKRTVGTLSDDDVARLNSWALGLRVLSLLPLPSQQRCSSLHEHPQLILEVLLMMKQLQSASLILKEFPSLRDDKLIISYAKKAISINVNSTHREPRLTISGSRAKQKKVAAPAKTNFVQSFGNFQREARKAFSWVPRDSGTKTPPKDILRKRKSSGSGGERSSWEAMPGVQEERAPEYPSEGQERLPFVSAPEEWVLTGDPDKDNTTRACHRYETSPDITLFKALLSLCTNNSIAGKGALEICITQMTDVLSSLQLPLHASMDNIARAYHATETYVQALSYAKNLLKKLVGTSDLSSSSERSRDIDDISVDTGSSSTGSQNLDELSDLLALADMWLGRAELLQSLLGSGIIASLDDFADKESSTTLRDRLVRDERYSMAVYTFWIAWGLALVRMEHYSQARVKFKQALQQYKGDATPFVLEIINTIEGGPPVDVSSVRSLYEHLAKSAATIFDDSLSADAYLNVLYMPSTFPRSERSRQSKDPMDSQFAPASSYLEDGPRSNLDGTRYAECIHYLQEYARPEMLAFMFRHGHYAEACSLFFPSNQQTAEGETPLSSIPRNDPLTTDYGTIDDLCDLCLGYGAMTVLENTILTITQSATYQGTVIQYMNAILTRICNYCETHRHFNYLYNFLVLKGDHVASGLCCIQLYINSMSQEEALKHLGHAKTHFEEALSVRDRTIEATKLVTRSARNKSASEKMTREMIMKFSTRVSYQMDVVKALNSADGPQWNTSLFGNPTDSETLRRRCMVVETLAEKHFDLAFRLLHEFDLPAVDIYAGVAASLAERKKGGQLTEFLKNIRGTIDDDEWDQVLGAAINVYANKHKERPDRLIDMLISNHRKVLACVVCGRLKSAFQIASRSGSVADVQYVAHQALHANALPVLDMCKQWLAQYM
uniref:ZFYVE26-like TPR repeats domain-containing protein n=1 Tax=Leersia perrieri TaxID=77586 RepID=A0A0D9V2H3_9ORYZ